MNTLEQDLASGVLNSGTAPCLSLYQPTSRHHPDNQQDPIRFANLVKSLEQSLAQKYSRDQTAKLLAPFRSLAEDYEFWRHTFEGLAVLATNDQFHIYRLQRPVASLAIVADSFHTKPLLRIQQSADRFQILGLSRTAASLYEGNRDALGAIAMAEEAAETLKDVLGTSRTEPHLTVASYGSVSSGLNGLGAHSAMHHGHGGRADEVGIETERYFRAVDRAVLEYHSQPSGLPLILAALPEHHQLFRSISRNPHLLAEGIDVHPDALGSLDALRTRAWQLLLPQYEARLSALVEEFGSARVRKLGDDVLPQVARAAAAGRVKTLLIEADRYIPGRLDVQTGRVEATDGKKGEHVDDLLDDLAELVISLGGNVVVVPSERMPTTTGVAAIYRFGPTRPDRAPVSAAVTAPVDKALEDHTVVELYDMAKNMKIRGRSSMLKAELIAAIRSAKS